MSNFTRANPLGWAPYEELTASQINQIDENLVKAANFTDGSVHAPAAVVEVGGSGFKLTSAGNTLEGAGAKLTALSGGGFYVGSAGGAVWQAGSDLITQSGSTVTWQAGTSWSMNCDANYGGTSKSTWATGTEIEVQAGALVDIQATATFTFANSPGFQSGATLSGGVFACSGTGHFRGRGYWHTSDTSITGKGINDCDAIIVEDGYFTTGRTCTLDTTGAQKDDEIEVVNLDPDYALAVSPFALKYAAGSHFAARFRYNGSAWVPVAVSPVTP